MAETYKEVTIDIARGFNQDVTVHPVDAVSRLSADFTKMAESGVSSYLNSSIIGNKLVMLFQDDLNAVEKDCLSNHDVHLYDCLNVPV